MNRNLIIQQPFWDMDVKAFLLHLIVIKKDWQLKKSIVYLKKCVVLVFHDVQYYDSIHEESEVKEDKIMNLDDELASLSNKNKPKLFSRLDLVKFDSMIMIYRE